MTSAIEFLARMGADANLRYASAADVERAAILANVDGNVQSAIVAGDATRLGELLGARETVCCIVAVPADEEDESDDDAKIDTRATRTTSL